MKKLILFIFIIGCNSKEIKSFETLTKHYCEKCNGLNSATRTKNRIEIVCNDGTKLSKDKEDTEEAVLIIGECK